MSYKRISINHRFGNVFMHVHHKLFGRMATLCKLTPEEAHEIGINLVKTSMAACKEKPLKFKKLKISK